jgi:hypothetical protein
MVISPLRNDGMPVEGTETSVASGQSGRDLKTVLDMLLRDMTIEPVDPVTLPWDRPIFILRSARMERLRELVDQIVVHAPAPELHIMSHARDEQALGNLVPCDFTFHPYPTPGRYRLEEMPPAMLDRLRAVDFGILFCLDTGLSADLFDAVDRVLSAIRPAGGISFGVGGTYARLPEHHARKRAETAFFRLIEWCQGTVDPAGAA